MAFAPGIPVKKTVSPPRVAAPIRATFSIQKHDADRAGPHHDLRLGYRGAAQSWAVRNWPGSPGQKSLAVLQPRHTLDYMNWSGRIEAGYGRGTVALERQGDCEILYSDSKKVKFKTLDGNTPEVWVLIRTQGNNWILFQRKPEPQED